jgi:hypothetical protein
MKTVAVTLSLLMSVALAADPEVIINSAEPMIGALEGLPDMDSVIVVPNYLPGYGLQLSSAGYQSEVTGSLDMAFAIRDILEGLSGTVQGLDPSDWVSAGLSYDPVVPINILVRLKPGQPDTTEIWIQGEKVN